MANPQKSIYSIPSMVDGLTRDQRKILFSAFKSNLVEELLVSRFGGYVYGHSAYRHSIGEPALEKIIVGMAQDFVGSDNNLNLLLPNGCFGSRILGGKDHGKVWHIYTQLSPVTRYLFPKDDDILLEYLKGDGKSIEPTQYMPIIPTVLVNGRKTHLPKYNPRDIVANIRRLLNGEPMEPMEPWYKGFRGIIEKSVTKGGRVSYTSTGIIEEIDETTLLITELPIGQWTENYSEFLKLLVIGNDKAKDPFIKGVRNCSGSTVHFEVTLSKENLAKAKKEGLLKKFKLTKKINTSNMIGKYDTPEKILEEFFQLRLAFYEKRKKVAVENLESEVVKLDNKVKFIEAVIKREIKVVNRANTDDFVVEFRDKGFTPFPGETSDYDYLRSLGLGSFNHESVGKLCAEKERIIAEIEEMKKETPESPWRKDLDALDSQLGELYDKGGGDGEELDREGSRSKFLKESPENPMKNAEKAQKADAVPESIETSNSSAMETDDDEHEDMGGNDFEVEVLEDPEGRKKKKKKKKGGRKPPLPPPPLVAATKKRGLTENAMRVSPEKKVRKRART